MVEKCGFEMLLALMGDDPYDFEAHKDLDPYSDDVWHFDVEFIEDHGAYKTIADRLSRMTGGDLVFDQVADYVDVEGEIAWVELSQGGKTERVELTIDNDSQRRFAWHTLGQDCLIVCLTPEKLKALNRDTGLRFRVMK
jgi:hypothetical protein